MDHSPAFSSCSSSSSGSSIHHASLVDSSLHPSAVLDLIALPIDRPLLEYIVECVVETVDSALGTPSAPSHRGRSRSRTDGEFTSFVMNMISRTEVRTPTLLAALVYVDRAKPHLHIGTSQWALHRVFLGALIVAMKYLNDSTLKNIHISLCTGLFSKEDCMRIEREFLLVLDWDLGISEADILSHHDGIFAVVDHSARSRAHRRAPPHRGCRSSTRTPDLVPSSPSSSCTSPRSSSCLSTPAIETLNTTTGSTQKTHSSQIVELLRSFPIPPIPFTSHQLLAMRCS